MNLHRIANAFIKAVHPNETVTLYRAVGQINDHGIIKPSYLAPVTIEAQVQEEADSGLEHVDTVNQTGHVKRFYVNKYVDKGSLVTPQSLQRQQERTGDIIIRADGSCWLITQVVEEFDLHVVLKGELLTVVPELGGVEIK